MLLIWPSIVLWAWVLARRMHRPAEELGFVWEDPGEAGPSRIGRFLRFHDAWRLAGTRDHGGVSIRLERRRDEEWSYYSIVAACFPGWFPFTMRVRRETALVRLAKAVFRIQDVDIGDDRFDSAVRIKSSRETGVRRVLSAAGGQRRLACSALCRPSRMRFNPNSKSAASS